MNIEIALALLAASIPAATLISKCWPSKTPDAAFEVEVKSRLTSIEDALGKLETNFESFRNHFIKK